MAPRRRAVVRTVSTPTAVEPRFSFPAKLLHPPQSQVVRYGDKVSERVAQLDLHAQRLGEGFGITFTSFSLNPFPVADSDSALMFGLSVLAALAHREERVTLERRNGRWGLYFTRSAAIVGQDQRVETLQLRDAPLDVRERFLSKSEAFFREYLGLCKDRLARMQGAVEGADRTLDLLAAIHLE